MTDRNKRRVTVAVAAILGATVSASLYARYADQPIGPERDAPRGAMCLKLADSPANQELKAKYDLALEAQKQAEADLADNIQFIFKRHVRFGSNNRVEVFTLE